MRERFCKLLVVEGGLSLKTKGIAFFWHSVVGWGVVSIAVAGKIVVGKKGLNLSN